MSSSHEDNVKKLTSQIQKTRQALQIIKDSMKPLETQLHNYEQQLQATHKQIETQTSATRLKEFLKLQPKISQWLDTQKVDFMSPKSRADCVSTRLTINGLCISATVIDDGGYHPKNYEVRVSVNDRDKGKIPERWLHWLILEDNPRYIKSWLERNLHLSANNDPIVESPKSDHHEMTGNWSPIYLIAYWFLSAIMTLESGF